MQENNFVKREKMPKIICKGAQNKGFKGADAVVITGMQIGGKKMTSTDTEKPIEQEMLTGDLRITLNDINYKPVDMVEVVRCKYCKHRADDGMCCGRGWPLQLVPDDGFCDKGERKEDGKIH